MKTTFFPWTTACLSVVLFAGGCATSRHGVSQSYRPAVVTDSIASRDFPTNPDTVKGQASNESAVESPKIASNSDHRINENSNAIVPVGFAVHEPLAVMIADSDEGSVHAEELAMNNDSRGWSLAQLEATALQQNPAIL